MDFSHFKAGFEAASQSLEISCLIADILAFVVRICFHPPPAPVERLDTFVEDGVFKAEEKI